MRSILLRLSLFALTSSLLTPESAQEGCPAGVPLVAFPESDLRVFFDSCETGEVGAMIESTSGYMHGCMQPDPETGKLRSAPCLEFARVAKSFAEWWREDGDRSLQMVGISEPVWTFAAPDGTYKRGLWAKPSSTNPVRDGREDDGGSLRWLCAISKERDGSHLS